MRKIALQLYTVRETAQKDFIGTLKEVAAIGYDGVELAGNTGGMSAKEMYNITQDLGLSIVSGHLNLETISSPKRLEPIIADYVTMGARYLGLAWMSAEHRTAAGYQRLGQMLERAALLCSKHDLTIFHHNHDFEFQTFGTRTGLEIMLENADASLVKAELDVYWAQFAGLNPVDWIKKLDGRVPLLHMKDMSKDESRTFEIVGEGVLDFDAILEAGDASGVDWYIVEQDKCPKGELESARASYTHIVERGWR
ncbi:MAG: sugar phosphate isomerase/epimerase [Anaerolineae bacterium]|nr:sugar phosphate isomerase/epimerase [Anaerolineae bacterium]